ncbi:MAG: hypothetical protein KA163_09015 [Bacteroidia bacterium]|nr:hypothetical protein [Bacteroidia bacterium]
MKSKLVLLIFLMLNIFCFSKTNLFKDRKSYFQSNPCGGIQENSLVRADSSRHHFISRVSICFGLINSWSFINFEKHNYSLANSYHLALISNKKNIAFKLGSIGEGESFRLNPKSNDGFRSGSFSYIGITKCFYFKKINYNIGLAGSFLTMLFYPNTPRDRFGGGLLMDISFNITKRFFITAYYINSINYNYQTELDSYFGCGIGMNFYEGKTRIW